MRVAAAVDTAAAYAGYARRASTPKPLTGTHLLAEQPPEVRQAVEDHDKTGNWPSYTTPAYVLYPYGEAAEPVINCAPLRTTDIQLEPGETITDVALGDSERWMVTPASSGDPRNPTPHLAVKPKAPGIATNLTIYTTRHIYHLNLRSRSGHEMRKSNSITLTTCLPQWPRRIGKRSKKPNKRKRAIL